MISRRSISLGGLAALICALLAVALVPAAVGAAKRAPATVKVTECQRGPETADRSAEFRGAMKRVKNTRRMWMKFTLQERAPNGKYRKVAADGLGVWRKSKPGVGRFAHRQNVLGLGRGTAYRVLVSYRWYGSRAKPIRRATRRSGRCNQPGPLPNLRVARIVARPAPKQPDSTRYVVRVVNDGRVASPRSQLRLSVDDDVADGARFGAIDPGDGRRVVLDGPDCADSVRVEIDPDALFYERSKADNDRTYGCPTG